MSSDSVNKPAHYNQGSIEVIDAIEDWGLGFHAGNVVKYLARSPHKGSQDEDVRKAEWYLLRLLDTLGLEPVSTARQQPPTDRDHWQEEAARLAASRNEHRQESGRLREKLGELRIKNADLRRQWSAQVREVHAAGANVREALEAAVAQRDSLRRDREGARKDADDAEVDMLTERLKDGPAPIGPGYVGTPPSQRINITDCARRMAAAEAHNIELLGKLAKYKIDRRQTRADIKTLNEVIATHQDYDLAKRMNQAEALVTELAGELDDSKQTIDALRSKLKIVTEDETVNPATKPTQSGQSAASFRSSSSDCEPAIGDARVEPHADDVTQAAREYVICCTRSSLHGKTLREFGFRTSNEPDTYQYRAPSGRSWWSNWEQFDADSEGVMTHLAELLAISWGDQS